MKYYEFTGGYYGLVQAETKERAVEIYEESIADLLESDHNYIKEIDFEDAKCKFLTASIRGGISYSEAKMPIGEMALLFDQSLL